ncbi:MAG: hypothetical protein ACRC2R_13120 [Xenococcaceae cyanobacterium]
MSSVDRLKQEASNTKTSSKRLRELATTNDELAKLVAANSSADSKLLRDLAIKFSRSKNLDIQRAIVSNSNTPTYWLLTLGSKFPDVLFSNSAFNSLSLNDSVDIYRSSLKLVFESNAPTSFLELAANICQTKLKHLRKNSNFQHFSLERQYEINIKRLRQNIGAWIGIYSFTDFWQYREILIAIASHKNISKKMLLELSASGEDIVTEFAQIRLDYLENYLEFWNRVALHKQINLVLFMPRKLIFQIIQLTDISINFLEAASQIEVSDGILNIIANHPKTSKQILKRLAKSEYYCVSEAAKLHINNIGELSIEYRSIAESKINRKQLPPLKNDERVELLLWKIGAISDSSLPYLNQNSIQEDTSTLLRIICCTDTPRSILDSLVNHPKVSQLIKDCISYVKQKESIFFELLPQSLPIDPAKLVNCSANQINSVAGDLNSLFEKLEDRSWWRKTSLLAIQDPKIHVCLVELMQKLTGSRRRRYYLNEMLRDFDKGRYRDYGLKSIYISNLEYYGIVLATHPKTSAQILSELTKHPSSEVRVLVASHKNITQNSLYNLINDRNSKVREAALSNPKIEPLFQEQLINLEDKNLSLTDLSELVNSKYPIIRARVARHPNIDRSILAQLANDKLIVRLAVARHPKTPAKLLTKFTQHRDRRLHLAVAQNSGAPIDLLIKLATEPANSSGIQLNPLNLAAIKTLLSQNPEAALPYLDRCLKFPDRPSFARFLILMNPCTSATFLGRYYRSWYWIERYAIAQNINTDRQILQQLIDDPNSIVRAAARDMLSNI